MKKSLLSLAILAAAALSSGCASTPGSGLSVNFDFNASYRSDVPLGTRTTK